MKELPDMCELLWICLPYAAMHVCACSFEGFPKEGMIFFYILDPIQSEMCFILSKHIMVEILSLLYVHTILLHMWKYIIQTRLITMRSNAKCLEVQNVYQCSDNCNPAVDCYE